jgi:hypothetical protein
MRHPIWKKDDVFTLVEGDHTDTRVRMIYMDGEIVQLPEEPLPLTWNFDWTMKSEGRVMDLRCEDGEITGEVEFFEDSQIKKMLEGVKGEQTDLEKLAQMEIRLGGYYGDVVRKEDIIDGIEHVMEATLRGVSFFIENSGANPGAKT